MKALDIPADGWEGLRKHWRADMLSGFLVFLLALPLSLGIAKASEFPPAMGVLTAMIGGLLVSLLAGSRLTIKGPAAGLITLCAGAVMEFGGGMTGWHMALGAMLVAGLLQIAFGFLRFGTLTDFFPHSAVHGMLAAIGLIIFAKQIHVLLGIDPATLKGVGLIGLYQAIPHSIANADPRVTLVGVISLVIIFGMPWVARAIPSLKKIPAPMVVLLVSVPMAIGMDFRHTTPAFDLVSIGDFWGNIGFNPDFSMISTAAFWKYVVMFLFINCLESLLTVKAIDGLDPWRRISNTNQDLVAVGAGNTLSAALGGLPMISEVARSSANVTFGAHTRWSNFFHGLFLLVAMLLFIPVIEMIPNTALAALLISVGYRLASPHEFFKTYKIGPEQLVVFVITIVVTISTDLLMGVGAGILTKMVFLVFHRVPLNNFFKARYQSQETPSGVQIQVQGSALFSNLLSFKKLFSRLDTSKSIQIDFTQAHLVDHTFMEFLHHWQEECSHAGGSLTLVGFDRFDAFSSHPLAARKIRPSMA
ncbi:MFS superfamily sulfate permease-like transporter [Azomonas agilis]|uniref:MFS superfamily sulfate permease-like transporter n=1 Tax=Azomonas agilis TaxID=116849 RepID=A0A562IZ93_9GAMM|nr:SulP family inorganic anion transporter [Azomonas agilis]TWH76216.1 MFS superfamily sulfate permease-like transporter [Azomonas agilis]